jgi:type VI secretion system secreted protein VgrG
MSIVELTFESGTDSLSVRRFSVQESISHLFEISVMARSPNDDVDLEAIVGKPAMFRITSGVAWALTETRLWTGICSSMEQVRVEPAGLSTYELTIVPAFWMLSQRRDNRLFQHKTIPEIVGKILSDWHIEHVFQIEPSDYPKLELRVQYGESDYDFICRLLEEAGISFYFADDFEKGTQLMLHDKPHIVEPRGASIPFFDDPKSAQAAEREYLTEVRVGHKVRPGKLTIRDFDFRRPNFSLFGEHTSEQRGGQGVEDRMEQYHYMPGACLTEGHAPGGETPLADDRGVARFHQPAGHGLAKRALESQRATKRLVRWKTNAMDLSPGVIFQMSGHPRGDLASDKRLLVNSFTLEGVINEEWTMTGSASFAEHPFRPAMITPKPRIHGAQSAIVVGPKSETVYTDEFGRVRVQFHWDREGKFDENSSIWMRVSQGWAGPGYGMINIPRVGHEVLVGFLDGDPDNPVVIGRVFNGAQQVPYKLPESKLMSAWKTDSNSNIILFIDIPTKEGFLEQAEKDRLSIVKNDQTTLIGHDEKRAIRANDATLIGGKSVRSSIGKMSLISGGEMGVGSKTSLVESAGLEISMVSGLKWEAGVQPILPYILASIGINIIKELLSEAFPSASPPDLQALLAAQMAQMGGGPGGPGGSMGGGGAPPGVSAVVPLPLTLLQSLGSLLDLKGVLKNLLLPLVSAIGMLTPAQIQWLLEGGPELDQFIKLLTDAAKKNQPPGAPPLPDFNAIMDQLKAMMAAMMMGGPPAGGSGPPMESKAQKKAEAFEKFSEVLKIVGEVVSEIMPGTRIKMMPNKIELNTGKASIKMDGDNIEIKAGGSIKIKGGSVSISPSPCKCG